MAIGRLASSTAAAPLELAIYDRVQRAHDVAPSRDIVVVGIDEASIARLGEWPWALDVHAGLLSQLQDAGARIVAFTVPLDGSQRTSESERIRAALALLESSNLGESEQAQQLRRVLGESGAGRDPDAHLAEAMAAHGDVIAPIRLELGEATREALNAPTRLRPAATPSALRSAPSGALSEQPAAVILDAASAMGHTGFAPDGDGVVRTDIAAVRIGDALTPSMAVAIAARAANITPQQLAFESRSVLLDRSMHSLESGMRARPHLGGSFPELPYWQAAAGEIPDDQLRGKIVLVGFTHAAAGSSPTVATPVDANKTEVQAIASAASSLMSGNLYARSLTGGALEWVIAALVVAFAAFALPAAGLTVGAIASLICVVVLLGAEVALMMSGHLWVRAGLPCVALLVGFGLYALGEIIRRANVRGESKDVSTLRNLGQTFQKQGQLDLAFETYQRCPLDPLTMDLLYQLGLDFEKRRQLPKAAAVYAHIAARDPNYRDLRVRRAHTREAPAPETRPPPPREPAGPAAPAASRDSRRAAVEDFDPQVRPRPASRTLGRYEIERELGKGAMGVVYLGRDPKINRVVAIKAIPLAEEF